MESLLLARRKRVPFPWAALGILLFAFGNPCLAAEDPAVRRGLWRDPDFSRIGRPGGPAVDGEGGLLEISEYSARELFKNELTRVKIEAPDLDPEFGETAKIRIDSDDYLDFDEQRNNIYGRSRTTVRYKEYTLTADKVLLDVQLQEAQAVGNVELSFGLESIKAEKMVFNFRRQQGFATHVDGQIKDVYFRGAPDEKKKDRASFQRLDARMSVLSGTSLTGCDFPIPHYRVNAKEFVILEQDRIFAKDAVLYIWEVPVMYIPAYTRSLSEHSAWSFILGYESELGGVLRTTYDYYYKDYAPPPEDDDAEPDRRTFSKATGIVDVFTDRGVGYGLRHVYDVDYDRHRGRVRLYAINDSGREVETIDGVDESGDQRYLIQIGHRSDLTQDIQFLTDVDWPRDPEIHYDILDFFQEEEEGRIPERHARFALQYVKQHYLARILFEMKERIGRDRYNNYSDPNDDDSDYDEDLDSIGRGATDPENEEDDEDRRGLPTTRWARVTERRPQITVATKWLKPFRYPLYYNLDVNLINNLDKGMNVLGDEDDSTVRGIDAYQQLMYPLFFGDHSTLVSQAGVGVGHMEREDDEFHFDFTRGVINEETGRTQLDGLTFTDVGNETFLVGEEEYSLSDVSAGFAYADFNTRWTTRFTEALTGNVRYKIRKGNKNSLGQWYHDIGSRLTRSDLYNFRNEAHEIGGGLSYDLAKPNLSLGIDAHRNLRNASDRASGENIQSIVVYGDYETPRDVFDVKADVGFHTTQNRHPSDPNQFEGDTAVGNLEFELFPRKERFWLTFNGRVWRDLTDDPAEKDRETEEDPDNPEEDDDDFDENDTEYDLTALVGAKIGMKWKGQIEATYDGDRREVDRVAIVLTRDLHDATLGIEFVAKKRYFWDDESQDDDSEENRKRRDDSGTWDKFKVKASISLKLPGREKPLTRSRIETLQDKRRRAQLGEEEEEG